MTQGPFNEYLWDRSGEPDEQVRRLESLLARFRLDSRLPPIVESPEGESNDEETR